KNTDEVESKGVEFEFAKKWKNGFEGSVSYSFQETINTDTKSILTNAPKNLGKLNVIAPLLNKNLTAGVELQYTGSRTSLANKTIGGFLTGNLTVLCKELVRGLEISASVYNVFDKKYADTASSEHLSQNMDRIVQDGRTFRLKMVYSF
ncbi:MAG: TonB-dependent receptor, partial [Syntrophorhabdus sp.]